MSIIVILVQRPPRLDTLENVMKFSQMVVQALKENKSPLLQLPHISPEHLRYFTTKKVCNTCGPYSYAWWFRVYLIVGNYRYTKLSRIKSTHLINVDCDVGLFKINCTHVHLIPWRIKSMRLTAVENRKKLPQNRKFSQKKRSSISSQIEQQV